MSSYNYQGPTDTNLRHSEIEGYQPVVINAFVDTYEHAALPDTITVGQVEPIGLTGKDTRMKTATDPNDPLQANAVQAENASFLAKTFETKPHFHEWATVLPGMICAGRVVTKSVSRKARNSTFRNYVAAETATPVLSCCACLGADDMKNFYFAGVARSKSVRPIDDGVGPQIDEYFTLAIGGMCTLLNTSGAPIYPGDCLEWTFAPAGVTSKPGAKNVRGSSHPRRLSTKISPHASERSIGRALSFAKNGECFDLLIKAA